MGKLSWNDLRLIYEGQYGVTADEASKWIARELFSKNYLGDAQKLGRMWEDIEVCIAFSEFLVEVGKFRKKNRYTEIVAFEEMHEQKHPAVKAFGSAAHYGMFKMGSKRFRNLCGQWKIQLRNAGFLLPKPMSEFQRKRLWEAAARLEKKQSKSNVVVKKTTKK